MSEPLLLESFIDQIAEHERRLAALERAPRLGDTSIREGTLTVLDSAGVARVKIGKDGTDYGVKVYDAAGANAVSLATLAFGVTADTVTTLESTSSTTYTDLTTSGPDCTVTIGQSGRASVAVSATITVDGQISERGFMAFAVSGATTRSPADDEAAQVNLYVFSTGGAGDTSLAKIASSKLSVVEGLTPGSNTFTAKYRATSNIGGEPVGFESRSIMVIPF